MMEPHVTVLDASPTTVRGQELTKLVRGVLQQSLVGATGLAAEVLNLNGMSGSKYRNFINSLVKEIPMPRYLEVGSWAGSTLCSAIYGNDVDAVAIDNWSQFGGPSDQFFQNLARFKGSARVSFLERDFRGVDYGSLSRMYGDFDIYLFDGPHAFVDQYDGIVLAQPALAPVYVQIVDDWNFPFVRNGTLKAIEDSGLHVDFMAEIRTSLDDKHAPQPTGRDSEWHNGYFIGVLSRPS
nr:hypothetical protein [uncultured Rhodopila sp.]